MPDLMQILSIFLKLQAVKQSGPGFLAYPVGSLGLIIASSSTSTKSDFIVCFVGGEISVRRCVAFTETATAEYRRRGKDLV